MTKDQKELKWRLRELPDAQGVAQLVEAKVLKPEEAREILLKEEGQQDVLEDLKKEVQLLKEVVAELTRNRPITVGIPQTWATYTPPNLPNVTYTSSNWIEVI